ncbi:NAD(P)-dependent oxidoreductase [Streptomyces sp. MUSC 14]|uniref:NAD(P)-dependent oxidoreductase n=1 Tax=Streptomyces sp. MUSC 14 TaxID=1354889 RepID=UPI000B292B7C|nr:NAD(P)H-binding protein [Streptomyces sp. MUSC 14]
MSGIVVLGAGGRAGRAVTAEARARGLPVTAVVREPARHPDLGAQGVTVVRGDVLDAGSVAGVAAGHVGAVHAVSPAGGPDGGGDAVDPGFCVRAADALVDGLGTAGVARLVVVGLGANLLGADGRMVLDGPVAFPAALRRFAPARTAGLDRLRKRGDGPVDRVVLTPAGFLEQNGPRTGRYRAGGERMRRGAGESRAMVMVMASRGCRTPISRWRWRTRARRPYGNVRGFRSSTCGLG